MEKRKRRFKKGIFSKLVISYILFFAITCLIFVLITLVSALVFSNGNIENVAPDNVVDENGNVRNLDTIQKIGGWVEELDAENHVIQIFGDKKTTTMDYSEKDIILLTSPDIEQEYVGILKYVTENDRRFLLLYPGDRVEHMINFNISDVSLNGSVSYSMVVGLIFVSLFAVNILITSLYLRRKIEQPLKKIIDGMNRLQNGEEHVTLEFDTEAEFEEIREHFNDMSDRLYNDQKEKQQIVQEKNQLLLELSHDIRTPIATIKSSANALEADLVPEEKRMEYYHTIERKADRIQVLTEDMFLMLKMDNAEYPIEKKNTDICEFLRKICAEYYEEITENGFDFDIQIPETKIFCEIDERLFSRVIGNLLLNAMKYNHKGNQICISVKEINEQIRIRVQDDGELLEEDLVKSMFRAFVRGDKARKSNGGTGLGLAISEAIVKKHGGTLSYENDKGMNSFVIILG